MKVQIMDETKDERRDDRSDDKDERKRRDRGFGRKTIHHGSAHYLRK
jgi:hypothetical protein